MAILTKYGHITSEEVLGLHEGAQVNADFDTEYQTLLVDVRLPDAVQLHVGLQLLAEVQPGVAANDTSEVDQSQLSY